MSRLDIRIETLLLWLGVALTLLVGVHLAVRGLHRFPLPPEFEVTGGDPARGREALLAHGCGGCHVIPGVAGARGRVGPKLADLINQVYVAGQVPNTPENLVLWIQRPQHLIPGTAMPNLPVSEQEARDMAAYLYSVR
jgi:cytochrome c